jgi:GNAT superfamily N-acetyltransferase
MTRDRRESSSDALIFRPAIADDWPGILELADRTLGWSAGDLNTRFALWKHQENPFGKSPMWVASDHERIVGFRAFMQWRFRDAESRELAAVRAVDTATDPEYQGRSIFTRLTLDAIDYLRRAGFSLIFNTPNHRSLPGYLKMGWSRVARLPVAVKLPHLGGMAGVLTARRPASRWSIDTPVGESATTVFADQESIRVLLLRRRSPVRGIATVLSPEFLAWRYGFEPLHYRALLIGSSPAEGLVVFRLRSRGRATEAVLCDALLPDVQRRVPPGLVRALGRLTGADYIITMSRRVVRPGSFVRLPGVGPILVCRRLDDGPVPSLRDWKLTLGDIELL